MLDAIQITMLRARNIGLEVINTDGEPLSLLENVNFVVPDGHFMAIVGPSGCGKTTLLKTIAGMLENTSGAYYWDGRNLETNNFEPSEIGFVPQFSIAYDQLDVEENIVSAAKLRCCFDSEEEMYERIDTILEETGMAAVADRPVKIISGGQKRRLALAMELVSKPRLFLCDEVTSGLDPAFEKEIVHLLHEISRSQGRIVISVTHSLADLDLYDSIMVLHGGNLVYHGPPNRVMHYLDVKTPEELYPKLAQRSAKRWGQSWMKHYTPYYKKMGMQNIKLMVQAPATASSDTVKESGDSLLSDEEWDELAKDDAKHSMHELKKMEEKGSEKAETADSSHFADDLPPTPSFFSQLVTLFIRRWRIFLRDRTQVGLQLAMILIFPVIVALFSAKGNGDLQRLSAERDSNILLEIKQQLTVQQNNVTIGAAVSGLIMFQIVLLGLMGSNNSSREIAGERLILEKEKFAGLRPSAYLTSKIGFLSVLILVQSFWMYLFVNYFWPFRGDPITHLSFLILANAAMTFTCLGISALSRTADQASLLSIYLVGFQLPLSGVVLALPEQVDIFVRPFISAFWGWSGSLSSLNGDVLTAVKAIVQVKPASAFLSYCVLGAHVLIGMIATYVGVKRQRWD